MVTYQEIDTPTYIKHLPLTLSFFKIQHLPFAFFTKCLLSLVKYGWKFSNDLLVPIINKNLQAVLVIVEIIFGGDLCKSFEEKDVEKHIFYIESDE